MIKNVFSPHFDTLNKRKRFCFQSSHAIDKKMQDKVRLIWVFLETLSKSHIICEKT